MSAPVFDANSPTTIWTLLNAVVQWVQGMLGFRPPTAAGTVSGGGSSATVLNVTFPSGRFTAPPVVVVTLASASGAHNWNAPRVYNITATGCSLFVNNGASATYNWVAVQ